MSRTCWVDVDIKLMTEKAICVEDLKGNDQWIALSQIVDSEDELGIGVATKIEIAEWLAEGNDLV